MKMETDHNEGVLWNTIQTEGERDIYNCRYSVCNRDIRERRSVSAKDFHEQKVIQCLPLTLLKAVNVESLYYECKRLDKLWKRLSSWYTLLQTSL